MGEVLKSPFGGAGWGRGQTTKWGPVFMGELTPIYTMKGVPTMQYCFYESLL